MSRSRLIEKRLKSREKFRKATGVFIIVSTFIYLLWRLTIFSDNWVFSMIFYLSEVLSYLLAVAMICSAWNYQHREPKKPKEGQKVDVFVPVYKEPIEMIRQTVRAAVKIRYPHATYVLDDGKRDEIKNLAEEFGAIYIRRPKNQGAKAGNLNHALEHATGDFIFVFDADHIAQVESIDAVLGFFEDETVAQVITPQAFYNLDGLQFMNHDNDRIWHEQSFFFNVAQACKDHSNSATSCGTGVMYRRRMIDEIGGFPELTITEDMHVSLLTHEKGHKSVYLNEEIAYGVAPADLADYYRTRERWAHGNLHVLKAEKPWKSKNLTMKQRLFYMDFGIYYMECWQQILLFLVPVISIFFAWQPFEITPLNVFIILTYPLLMMVLQDEQGCGMTRNWTSQLFSIARMPVQMTAWAACFGRKLSWRTSKKNLAGDFDWKLVMPQTFLTLLSLAALIYGIIKIPTIESTGPVTGMIHAFWNRMMSDPDQSGMIAAGGWHEVLNRGYSWDLLLISTFWLLYNASRTSYWLLDTYRRTKNTHSHYRFKIPLLIEDTAGDFHEVEWISETSLRIMKSNPAIKPGDSMSFQLWLPAGAMHVRVVIEKSNDSGYDANFVWETDAQRDQLCDALFSVDWHAEIHQREGYFPTILEQAVSRLKITPKRKTPKWRPCLMQYEGAPNKTFAIITQAEGTIPTEILGFGERAEGRKVSIIQPYQRSAEYLIGEKLDVQGLCRIGLDGCVRWKSRVMPINTK